ncbi:ABC transporter substrate-binding protein [Aquibacillus halophilus]|uniref:ABC transporter substrate-binding protein n=1 Tax=Aquibacillus halophilus TaxID=930132 RepID=A0A6A8DE56_9BACI|nr:ABC transporter substrate-binding protein [Aquibacillus halophilus]MRH41197.1 ABC transporter substrate-binding protein [Aquibacillus halophilus]
MKKVFGFMVLMFTLVGIVGCSAEDSSSEGTGSESSEEVIKIGGIGPLTPPGSPELGEELQQSMQLAIDEINADGGVLGKDLELYFEDSSGAPEKGQSAMEKLITKENVVAIAGEGHSSAALAEIEVAKRNNVPFIVAEAWSDAITEKGYEQVFRVAPNNTMFSKRIVEFVEEFGYENISIIAEDSDWGIGNVDLLKQQFEEKGIKFNSTIVSRETKDYVPQLLELTENNEPDLLLNIMTGVGAYLVVKQAHELGISPTAETAMFMGGADAAYPEIWETTGEASKYVIWQTPYSPKAKFTDLTEPMVEAFKEEFDRNPSYVALHGYDTVLILADAIERAGSTDPDEIIAALEETKLMGTRGEVTFPLEKGPDYHNWLPDLLFMQYTEIDQAPDDAEIVFPSNVATSDIVIPE